MLEKMASSLAELRKRKPLILNLTNYVTMDFMANSLLALGAAPLMSQDIAEIPELIKISDSINLNIGTLDPLFIKRCKFAIDLSKNTGKPLVLDPVGAGASWLRTECAKDLMQEATIIRGNATEIIALSKDQNFFQTLGVEAVHEVDEAKRAAQQLAQKLNCTIVVTGKEDYISDGKKNTSLFFGSPIMPFITGMGCTLTAVIAAFKAVISDAFEAAQIACAYFSLCGNLAGKKTKNPGSFRTFFIDELFAADFKAMKQYC